MENKYDKKNLFLKVLSVITMILAFTNYPGKGLINNRKK